MWRREAISPDSRCSFWDVSADLLWSDPMALSARVSHLEVNDESSGPFLSSAAFSSSPGLNRFKILKIVFIKGEAICQCGTLRRPLLSKTLTWLLVASLQACVMSANNGSAAPTDDPDSCNFTWPSKPNAKESRNWKQISCWGRSRKKNQSFTWEYLYQQQNPQQEILWWKQTLSFEHFVRQGCQLENLFLENTGEKLPLAIGEATLALPCVHSIMIMTLSPPEICSEEQDVEDEEKAGESTGVIVCLVCIGSSIKVVMTTRNNNVLVHLEKKM